MNPTKSKVKQALDALQFSSRRLQANIAELARAEKTLATTQNQITSLGVTNYTDDAAINKVALAERKATACQRAIEQIETELPAIGNEFTTALTDAAAVAAAVLTPLWGRRIDTITAVIKPFYFDATRAGVAANQSDAGAAAHHRLMQLCDLQNRQIVRDPLTHTAAAIKVAGDVEAILEEALKKSPDLLQFFDYDPTPTAPVDEIQAEAAAAPVDEDAPAPATEEDGAREPAPQPAVPPQS